MNRLTIEARSLKSAQEIEVALRGFERWLQVDDHGCHVQVTFPPGDQGIVAVLNALEEYVRQRGDGPAQISVDGQSYTLEALPSDD
jgi:hypothetical protein